MNVQEQIERYITSQTEPKRSEIKEPHNIVLRLMPGCKLWFLDGKKDDGKTVSNPSIGYGFAPRNMLMGQPESSIRSA